MRGDDQNFFCAYVVPPVLGQGYNLTELLVGLLLGTGTPEVTAELECGPLVPHGPVPFSPEILLHVVVVGTFSLGGRRVARLFV